MPTDPHKIHEIQKLYQPHEPTKKDSKALDNNRML